MIDFPPQVWAAVLGVVGGAVGVGLGAVLQRSYERKHWERQIRLDTYRSFLTALDEELASLGEKPVDWDKASATRRELQNELSRLALIASEDAAHGARNAALNVTLLDYTGRMIALRNIPVSFDHKDFSDIQTHRWSFIKAVRKDLGITPVEIPMKVITPTSDDEEAIDGESS